MVYFLSSRVFNSLAYVQGILTTLSQSNGKYKYDYATIPFLAELFKLSFSSFFLWKECQSSSPPRMTKEWRSIRLYLVPSVIYLIHNNVQFATLTYVDPSTYQIMGNLKIVTTGILFRLVLKRKLSNLQWMAVVLLAVGTTTSQVCEHFETLFPFVLAYTIGLCLCYLTKLLIQTCYKKWTGGLTGKKNLVWSV